MPQMINNLELEVKRHRLQRQFIRMVELDEANDNFSQENKTSKVANKNIGSNPIISEDKPLDINSLETESTVCKPNALNRKKLGLVPMQTDLRPDTSLKLSDTEHPDLKIGIQNGN